MRFRFRTFGSFWSDAFPLQRNLYARRAAGAPMTPDLLPLSKKCIEISRRQEVDRLKTVYAFIAVLFAAFLNEVAVAFIHDYVPQLPPLPDVSFSVFPEIPSAIAITEYIMMFLVLNAAIVMICHQHRWIVIRRVVVCFALAYTFRALCISVLGLPVPSPTTYCAPRTKGGLAIIMDRVERTFWSAGIEQLRARELCGDLIVSGHTLTLFISMMTFRHYTPRRFVVIGYVYNVLAIVGIFCILCARKHYSLDIIFGYFVATRIYWEYHALANSYHQNEYDRNPLSQSVWAPLVRYMESDAPPPHLFLNVLEWPSSCPSKLRRHFSM